MPVGGDGQPMIAPSAAIETTAIPNTQRIISCFGMLSPSCGPRRQRAITTYCGPERLPSTHVRTSDGLRRAQLPSRPSVSPAAIAFLREPPTHFAVGPRFRGGHMPDKRILLVEDDEDVGALLGVALEGDGYE